MNFLSEMFAYYLALAHLLHFLHFFLFAPQYSSFSLYFFHFKINIRKQKGEKITIWERNFQLALYSIILLCIVLVYEIQYAEVSLPPGSAVPQMFFKGWTHNTVIISLIQAVRTYVHACIHAHEYEAVSRRDDVVYLVSCSALHCVLCSVSQYYSV